MHALVATGWLLRISRWLVAAFALGMLALSLAGLALFPNYAWTPEQVQAGLAELGWPATTVAWLALGRDLAGLCASGALAFLLLQRRAGGWFGLFTAFVFVLLMSTAGPFL